MSYPIRHGFKKVTGTFAFWRYDLFPHVLGGPVMAMNDEGLVQVETYGGSVFKPILIVPRAKGAKMLAEIEALRDPHRTAEQAFHKEWRAKIEAIIPQANRADELRDYAAACDRARARR